MLSLCGFQWIDRSARSIILDEVSAKIRDIVRKMSEEERKGERQKTNSEPCGEKVIERHTCQWKRSSPAGPALHEVGGSFCRSCG